MNEQHVAYFAKKFFPHLIPSAGIALVRELLIRRGLYRIS